jgi:hypothetical protein
MSVSSFGSKNGRKNAPLWEIVATAERLQRGAREHDKSECGYSKPMDSHIPHPYFTAPHDRLRPVLPQLSMNVHLHKE